MASSPTYGQRFLLMKGVKKMDYLFDLRCVSKSWKAQAETNVLWLAY